MIPAMIFAYNALEAIEGSPPNPEHVEKLSKWVSRRDEGWLKYARRAAVDEKWPPSDEEPNT